MSLRIAHVQPVSIDLFGYRDDDWGTTFRYFLPNLTTAQVDRGDYPTAHVLTAGRYRHELVVRGVPVVFHPCLEPQRGKPTNRRFSRQLSVGMLRAIRSDDCDVVHFHGARSLHGMLAAVVCRARAQHLPVIAHDHGPRAVGTFMRAVHRSALARCDGLLAGNEEARAELLRHLPPERVRLLPNGVEPAVFHPDDGARRNGASTPLRVLVVSRLMEDKDPLIMAEALATLVRRGCAVAVTIVGVGDQKAAVGARLRSAGVPVTFVDSVAQPELAALYRGADVFVLSSLREGFNQVSLEAMASGLPVVVSDVAGLREGVGDAGVLVPPGDVAAFADALERLATDPAWWCELRRRGLSRARHFTWPAIADQLDGVYRAVIR